MAQTWGAWWGLDLVRTILGWIDWVFFEILGWVYEVFYAVATAELFTGETVYNLISRIQLILGIFMVFKLTMMILKSMVNPDYLNDKQSGTSQIITRIVTSLVMLSLIVPLNIQNPSNRYQVEVNNNGIMFGTLYSLQKRILENDVLGQLILGNDAPKRASDGSVVSSGLPGIKDKFISTIAKGFVQRNHKSQDSEDYMCPDSDFVKDNNYDNATVTDLFLDHINDECGNRFLVLGTNYYAFAYLPIIGGVVAIIFTVLFAVFSIDIAIRTIKLSVLRLIAPIPIISYMEPGQEKKGAFASWLKLLIATYLDLFIRLAMVYFALFLIDDIIKNGLIMNGSMGVGGITGVVAFIVICIGLLLFAKMAPKFITEALGIQSHMSNIGLSALFGGTAMALGGGGLAGFGYGAMNSLKSSVEGEAAGKPVALGDQWSQNRDAIAKIRTGDKDAQGGIFGGLNDKFQYKTREHIANNMGIGAKDLAKASYVEGFNEDNMRLSERELRNATSALNAFGNNGNEMNRRQFIDATGDSSDVAYESYRQQYQAAKERVQNAQRDYDKYSDAYAKASKDKKRIESERDLLRVSPRVVDVESDKATYRTNYSVVTNDEGLAVDKAGRVTNNPADYQYEQKTKQYTGTLDDQTIASLSRPGDGGPPPSMPR